jgi:LacI family transcriptional regulator, galactose operon repressor
VSGSGEGAVVRKVGIREVARAAGVSVTTVSHVLNDTPNTRTSEVTRERVRAVARELGYSPNRLARGLRTRTSGMIGLLTEEIATTPHAGRIILGAQEEASRHNLTLAIINSHLNAGAASRRADARALIERHADGIIYATVFHREVSVPLELRAVPAALIGAVDRQGLVPAVLPDEAGGAADLVSLLVASGHRRIGFANSSVDVPATRGRLVGYRRGLAEAGIPWDESLIEAGVSEAIGGYEACLKLLQRPDRPSAQPAHPGRCVDRRLRRPGADRGEHVPVAHDRRAPALRDGRVGGKHSHPAHQGQQRLLVLVDPSNDAALPGRRS